MVTATNAVGTSKASSPATATPAGVPFAPTSVTAAAGDTLAGVSWLAPNPNGSAITSYTVTSDPGDVVCVSTTTNCTVDGLVDGISYTFTVTATNAVGTSAASMATGAVVPDGQPPAVSSGPTVTVAPSGVLNTTASSSRVPVQVSWTVTAGVAPVCSEQAQSSVDGGQRWSNITLASATATTAETTMTPGVVTEFRVRATGCDDLPSAWATTGTLTAQLLQESASNITYSSGWKSVSCSSCSGGAAETTTTSGASAQISLKGVHSVGLVTVNGPTQGAASVATDGNSPVTVNTNRPKPQYRTVTFATSWAADGNHRLVVTNKATKGDPGLEIDAVITIG